MGWLLQDYFPLGDSRDLPGFPIVAKNLPANSEDPGSTLGWKDPLEEDMATHFNILAWRITWTEEPGGLQSHWVAKNQT